MTYHLKIRKTVSVVMSGCILLCMPLLTGCGLFTTRVEIPKEVKVIVSVPCMKKENLPTPPSLRSDDELLALDRYKRTLAMWEDRRARQAFEAEQSAVLVACGG